MPNKYLDSEGLAEYTGLVKSALNLKADLASPALTGTPTAPTPAVGDDSTKIATTEFVNTKASDYLPLAGGTLTGNVYTGGDISRTTDTSRLSLNGGRGNDNGAYLNLYGKSHSTYAGLFSLSAYDGTNRISLAGKPDGTLTWNGSNVITAAGGTMTGAINMNSNAVNMGTGSNDNGRMYTISNVLRLTGGSNTSTGSYVDVGSPNATNQGVKVTAKNTTNETSLLTTPDGGLFWNDVRIGLQNGTYNLNFYGFGYITASGTSLDMSFPYVAKGKDIRFNSLFATLRSYKGYLSPGGSGGSDILTGSTQGTWYKKDSACPCTFRLVRSGGWGSNGENNTLVVGEFTANVTVTDA